MKQGIASVGLGLLAGVSAFAVHHWVSNDVQSLGSFLFALVPFVLAIEAVAWFPLAWTRPRWIAPACVALLFLVAMGGFAPLMFGAVVDNDFDRFYSIIRVLMPFIIVAMVAALRLGGARGSTVRRGGYAALLIMLSGIEDLMFQVWRGNEIPDSWDWAEHMTVRLGHVASQNEAFGFIAVHLLLALLVVVVPWPLRSRNRTEDPAESRSANPVVPATTAGAERTDAQA